MTASFFIDTNVLVYVYTPHEPDKQQQAIDLLSNLVRRNAAAISTQVLIEFVSAVTRKIPLPLSAADTYTQVEELIRAWTVIDVTSLIVLEAIRGVRDHGFSIWDAQIWATARLNGIPVVISEDFSTGSVVEGVQFTNPFVPSFDIAGLIGTT